MNGFGLMVMTSHENADRIIKGMKDYVRAGGRDLNDYQTILYRQLHIDLDRDVLSSDKIRIKEEIERFCKTYYGAY